MLAVRLLAHWECVLLLTYLPCHVGKDILGFDIDHKHGAVSAAVDGHVCSQEARQAATPNVCAWEQQLKPLLLTGGIS